MTGLEANLYFSYMSTFAITRTLWPLGGKFENKKKKGKWQSFYQEILSGTAKKVCYQIITLIKIGNRQKVSTLKLN